jgi:predicted Zn finger-like uncharacterized protein
MILTCPECATSYLAPDDAIPPQGRTVKCANCGARWMATPTPPEPEEPAALELIETPDESVVIEDPPAAEPPERPGDELPKIFRARADTNRKVREAAAMGVVWAAAAMVLAGVIGASIVFRNDVVRFWPKTASAFALIGLPVNSLSLSIEGVGAEPVLRNGHAALLVKGMIRNVGDKPVTAPPIRIKLLNAQGRSVAEKIARWSHPQIPPGESRVFSVPLMDPPSTSRDVEVAFAPELAGAAAGEGDAHAEPEAAKHEPERQPPEPAPAHAVEAEPLPADDPNAAPAHHE